MAIAPQTLENNKDVKEKHRLEFPLLRDPANAYAGQLSLAFELQDYLKPIYLSFGIDLPHFNGEDSWTLPVPMRAVVDGHGVVCEIEADADYTQRPEPEDTLEALRAI